MPRASTVFLVASTLTGACTTGPPTQRAPTTLPAPTGSASPIHIEALQDFVGPYPMDAPLPDGHSDEVLIRKTGALQRQLDDLEPL